MTSSMGHDVASLGQGTGQPLIFSTGYRISSRYMVPADNRACHRKKTCDVFKSGRSLEGIPGCDRGILPLFGAGVVNLP